MQALKHTKAKYLISQLQALGFHDWQCAVAIMQYGSNLEACIAFLLEDHITSEEDSKAYMVASAHTPPIDISEELGMLADAQVRPRRSLSRNLYPLLFCVQRAQQG